MGLNSVLVRLSPSFLFEFSILRTLSTDFVQPLHAFLSGISQIGSK